MTDVETGGLPAVFALLDDGQAGRETPALAVSRLYTGFAHERVCTDPALLESFWETIESDLHAGLHPVLLADYEWGVALQRGASPAGALSSASGSISTVPPAAVLPAAAAVAINAVALTAASTTAFILPPSYPVSSHETPPALRVLLFRDLRRLTGPEVADWLDASGAAAGTPAGIADVRQSVDEDTFSKAIAEIQAALLAGACYQINYTFRLGFQVFGEPPALYRRLRERQPVPFGAMIHHPRGWTLSFSPELFLRHQAGQLLAKPMKGTAARDADPLADAQRGAELAADPKNRAENVMIVDLLRNDLGKLAPPGGVSVQSLFSVEAWPTVWQMTSTVAAPLPATTGFPAVLRALFPCGSITGAPKHAAMDHIDRLESTPRGLYTGAIGWLDAAAEGRACGDFCLSVAIRTVSLAGEPVNGVTDATVGIGAGIVLDSEAEAEYRECLLKACFLTGVDPGFALFETMLATEGVPPDTQHVPGVPNVPGLPVLLHIPYRARHLARLETSARRLGFLWDAAAVATALDSALVAALNEMRVAQGGGVDSTTSAERAAGGGPLDMASASVKAVAAPRIRRVRLSLTKAGDVACTTAPMTPLADGPVGLLIARECGLADTHADDFLLGFKNTHRAQYDRAWQMAEREGAFDAVFMNTHGHLTEGGRTNLFVKLGGRWYTPPLSDGVLPGVMRAVLLDDPAWQASERTLVLDDLLHAEALVLTNALRGAMPACLRTCVPAPETSPLSPHAHTPRSPR